MTKSARAKFTPPPAATARQIEDTKTSRLRALRLEREAADREAANRVAAAAPAPVKRGRP